MTTATPSLTIQVLGSGTSIPATDRQPPAYLARCGETALLIDCGSGAMTSLVRAGLSLNRLSGIALSHFHLDHTADLAAILFALSNPAHPARDRDLPIWGPRGTSALLERLETCYGRWVRPRSCSVAVSELEPEGRAIEIGPLRISAFEVQHTAASLALRIEAADASVCFSGDSGPCAGLARAAAGVDLLLCECAALEDEELPGHMRASDVGRLAASAGCKQVVLTHLYDHVVRSEPVARVTALYDGPVRLAADGMLLDPLAPRARTARP